MDERQYIDAIGREALRERLGLTWPSAITEGMRRERLPASWYAAMCDLGEERQMSPPRREWFAFKLASAE